MILTIEFFLGLIATFFIGYLIASALEKIFKITLDLSNWHNQKLNKKKKHA
jgi:hypothetical protein